MKIALPWPDRRLSPNSRAHWAVKANAKAKARRDAAYATYGAIGGGLKELRAGLAGDAPIAFRVTFYPPDNRHRDDDNMIGSFKAARDGIADALAVNDRRFRPEYRFEAAEKPGRIEVELSPISAQKASGPIGGNACHDVRKAGQESARTLDPDPAKSAIEERI